MGKKLVAYFSASGVTAKLATALAQAVGADLYEIKPETPYTGADLNWNDKGSRSSVEMQNPASRPAIADAEVNLAAYDAVFVGFPIWWYVAPTIINTFLEQHSFSGKIVIPFATSGGSGLGGTVKKLRPSAPGAVWKDGKLWNGGPDKQALAEWANSQMQPGETT